MYSAVQINFRVAFSELCAVVVVGGIYTAAGDTAVVFRSRRQVRLRTEGPRCWTGENVTDVVPLKAGLVASELSQEIGQELEHLRNDLFCVE